MLITTVAVDILIFFLLYFLEKVMLDISCDLFLQQMIHMKSGLILIENNNVNFGILYAMKDLLRDLRKINSFLHILFSSSGLSLKNEAKLSAWRGIISTETHTSDCKFVNIWLNLSVFGKIHVTDIFI